MGLGLSNEGNNSAGFKAFLKYNAQAGRLYKSDRVQDADGTWRAVDTDITKDAQFVADMLNVTKGWIYFSAQGPIRHMVRIDDPMPPRPEQLGPDGKPAFKKGFLLHVAMPQDMGGGVRELSSTAQCAIDGVSDLHDLYSAAPESKEDKLPVVRLVDTQPVKSQQSTNFKPVFEILAWIARPKKLDEAAEPPAQTSVRAAPNGTAPATGATRVNAPPTTAWTNPNEPKRPVPADFG